MFVFIRDSGSYQPKKNKEGGGYAIQFGWIFNGLTWKKTSKMAFARDRPACAVLNGRILVAGGCDGNCKGRNGFLKSVEVYDPDLDTWERVADLDFPVTSAKMDILHGLPTLVGGFTGSYGNTDLIQYFKEEDRWIPLNGVKLEITRSSPVVFQVPKDYFNIC